MTRTLIPNSTQIPDVILDFWLSELSGAELKVVLYVARRTYGFGKESDTISINQMADGIQKRNGTVLDRGTGLSRSTVKTVCAALVERGILLKTTNVNGKTGEFEENTYRLNLDWTSSDDDNGPEGGVGRKSAQVGQKDRGEVGRKSARRWPESAPRVGRKSTPQETEIQETDPQETAAGEAAALTDQLVKRGVNRVEALRLVQTNPTECARQIEFLAYMPPRKDEARWLVAAIQGEYGPPKAYRDGKAREAKSKAQEEQERAQAKLEMARLSHQAAQEGAYLDYLASQVSQVEIHQPEAFMAFQESEAKTRAFFAKTLPGRIAQYDDKRAYLTRFAEFFASRKEAMVLSFWEWDRQENRTPLNQINT